MCSIILPAPIKIKQNAEKMQFVQDHPAKTPDGIRDFPISVRVIMHFYGNIPSFQSARSSASGICASTGPTA